MQSSDTFNSDIAIIGLAGRFPGSKDLAGFWQNLRDGVESVSFFSDEELIAEGVAPDMLRHPNCVKARAVLDNVESFDAEFFGLTPREAEITDPQHRLFLECAWESLEDAGYDSDRIRGRVGVFGGVSLNSYWSNNLQSNRKLLELVGAQQARMANRLDNLSTKVSYRLNLRGPSLTVQTACSTSLVAVHLACQSILNGECEMALAGGVAIYVPRRTFYLYQEGAIGSPDGHCRAFDAGAAGFAPGEGVGIVALKRLADAQADKDHIYAIIKGSAINNDGSIKIGYTAPSIEGQSEVIAEAMALAQVDPETISYIEAHGTATPLGDPIEIAALTEVFRAATSKNQFCAIGSVKTNIGHLDTAAGIAGLIKTVLSLHYKQIPPSLHFSSPNPKIDFLNSPFFVASSLTDWPDSPSPRRAGVSSFGIGGTNAHIVLEEAPPPTISGPSRSWQALVLSAKSQESLERATDQLADYLQENEEENLADVAYTLEVGRKRFRHRRALICRDRDEAVAALRSRDRDSLLASVQEACDRPVVFMFPGQGSQHPLMGAALYHKEEIFRYEVDQCSDFLEPLLGYDLREVLYPAPGRIAEAAARLEQTAVTQPALFVIEYALAKMWIDCGVIPQAMIGHSIGEYVAACLAGVFSLEEALTLTATRGRLMQSLPKGAMLGLSLSEAEARPILNEKIAIAAINSPSRCVVSGETEAIAELERQAQARGITCRLLATSHAFHSYMVEPIIDSFIAEMERVNLRAPEIPYISNVTGTWVTDKEATSADYWAMHMRQTVRFADGLQELLKDRSRIFLEIGPGRSLATSAKQTARESSEIAVIASMRNPGIRKSDVEFFLNALAHLWIQGAEIDWERFYSRERRCRLSLPLYPFNRKRHWIDRHTGNGHQAYEQSAIEEAPESPDMGAQEIASWPSQAATPSGSNRRDAVLSKLKTIIADLAGIETEEMIPRHTFFDLGFDSLLLMRISQAIETNLGIGIAFRDLFEKYTSLEAVTDYITQSLPPENSPAIEPEQTRSERDATVLNSHEPLQEPEASLINSDFSEKVESEPSTLSALERVIARQHEIMSQQLEAIRRIARAENRQNGSRPGRFLSQETEGNGLNGRAGAKSDAPSPANFGPWRPVSKGPTDEMTAQQRRHLDELTARLTRRTQTSKRLAQDSRRSLADNRASVGFRLAWKEMVYPIAASRSKGARLWDVDGNEYIDLVMGFGVNLFGHSPDFITRALNEQIEYGIHLGAQFDRAAEAAELICDLTGMERVNFCNTGSEAVMGAIRLARAVSGRKKIALFAGSYHGISDGVLARAGTISGEKRSAPVALGIPENMIADAIVLDYAKPESLEYISRHARELAAVLVEPVQSRRPDLQPKEFLKELREITEQEGIALIFDEMITGFRIHPGGAQAWFGIEADLATYGKIIGGGLPIGVIAGRARFLDAVDGGDWNYGDDSYPRANQTFFAGTFCKHPLAMAAALATLKQLKTGGPSIQQELNRRTDELAERLNSYFKERLLPLEIKHFASLFRPVFTGNQQYSALLFYNMLDRGIHIWDGRNCFLSTEHTSEDIEQAVQAIQDSAEELREAGFLNAVAASQSSASDTINSKPKENRLPLTEAQRGLWAVAQMGDEACQAFNEAIVLHLRGELRIEALRRAFQQVVNRHDALRAGFSPDGSFQRIADSLEVEMHVFDLAEQQGRDAQERINWFLEKEARHTFDLSQGPLVRANLLRVDEREHYLSLVIHHLVTDGWSVGVLLKELWSLYRLEIEGGEAAMPPAGSYGDYVQNNINARRDNDSAEAESFWIEQFAGKVPLLDLPTDRPRPPFQTFAGARQRIVIDPEIRRSLKQLSASFKCTLFTTLLSGFETLLGYLTGQDDLVVGIHSSGQAYESDKSLVGFCINMLPIRSRIDKETNFADLLAASRKTVFDAQQHRSYPFGKLVKKLDLVRDPSRPPLVSVIFNLDRSSGVESNASIAGLEVTRVASPVVFARFDLLWNMVETENHLALDCTFNRDLFEARAIERWLKAYNEILLKVCEQPVIRLGSLFETLAETQEQERSSKERELKQTRTRKYKGLKRKVAKQTVPATLSASGK